MCAVLYVLSFVSVVRACVRSVRVCLRVCVRVSLAVINTQQRFGMHIKTNKSSVLTT